MSRENPHIKVTVDGTLTGTKNYQVKIILTLRELWGTKTVPDEVTIVKDELLPMSDIVVEDGDYVLRYSFDNGDYKFNRKVVGGRLRAP